MAIMLVAITFAFVTGCSHGRDAERKSQGYIVKDYKNKVQILKKNATFEMYTHNPKLPPFIVRANSLGIRDREYPLRKPPGTLRIVILGDSFLFGWGVEQDETFDEQLERIYKKRGRKVEVINLAIPGQNHISELKMLKSIGLKYDPDIVLMQVNLDDFYPDYNNYIFEDTPVLPHGFESFSNEKRFDKTKEKFMTRFNRIRNAGELENNDFMKLFDVFAAKPITEAAEIAKKNDIELTLLMNMDNPMVPAYKQLAEKLNIRTIDMYSAQFNPPLEFARNMKPLFIEKDGHPTAFALAIFARYVADNLELPPTNPTSERKTDSPAAIK